MASGLNRKSVRFWMILLGSYACFQFFVTYLDVKSDGRGPEQTIFKAASNWIGEDALAQVLASGVGYYANPYYCGYPFYYYISSGMCRTGCSKSVSDYSGTFKCEALCYPGAVANCTTVHRSGINDWRPSCSCVQKGSYPYATP